MDVNSNPIGNRYRRLALDLAFSAQFILVDNTAATGYIQLYSQLWWPLGHGREECVRYWTWSRVHTGCRSIQKTPRIRVISSLDNTGLGSSYVAPNWWSGEIKKGHTNIGYIDYMAPQQGNYSQMSHVGCMHTNATANDGEPHPVAEPITHHRHPSYECNHQTCYIHEVLWSWPVLHWFGRW